MRRLLRFLDVRRWFQPPPMPQRLLVADVLYLLDGGTTIILGTDEAGRRRQMALSQHQLPESPGKPPPAGRFSLDGWRVPPGGEAEAALLRVLDASADEYLNRPPGPELDGPSVAESMGRRGGTVLFGGDDLRDLYSLSPRRMKVKLIRDLVTYLRSAPAATDGPNGPQCRDVSMPEATQVCPRCGRTEPADAAFCYCGFIFPKAGQRGSPLPTPALPASPPGPGFVAHCGWISIAMPFLSGFLACMGLFVAPRIMDAVPDAVFMVVGGILLPVLGLTAAIVGLASVRKYGPRGLLRPCIAGLILNLWFLALVIPQLIRIHRSQHGHG